MKDAADLKAKAKNRRRERRNHDKDRKDYEKPRDKKPYNRKDWKAGKVD